MECVRHEHARPPRTRRPPPTLRRRRTRRAARREASCAGRVGDEAPPETRAVNATFFSMGLSTIELSTMGLSSKALSSKGLFFEGTVLRRVRRVGYAPASPPSARRLFMSMTRSASASTNRTARLRAARTSSSPKLSIPSKCTNARSNASLKKCNRSRVRAPSDPNRSSASTSALRRSHSRVLSSIAVVALRFAAASSEEFSSLRASANFRFCSSRSRRSSASIARRRAAGSGITLTRNRPSRVACFRGESSSRHAFPLTCTRTVDASTRARVAKISRKSANVTSSGASTTKRRASSGASGTAMTSTVTRSIGAATLRARGAARRGAL